MCLDPVSLTAMALAAGGQYMQTREANQNANRMTEAKNAAYQTDMNRQAQYADEASAAFNHNIQNQGRESFDQQAAKTADATKQAFTRVQTPEMDYNDMGALASTPNNVIQAMKDKTAEADAKTTRDLNNNAALQGYGGALFDQNLNRNDFARMFGNMQDKASRDAALIPLDLSAAANNANKAPSLFPTLLKGAGMALGMYGAANGITSFGDKMVPGAMPPGVYGPGVPTMQPGLFSTLKTSAAKTFGGLY